MSATNPSPSESNVGGGRFTSQTFWDDYWKGTKLPAEVKWSRDHGHNEILKAFTRFMPRDPSATALEIGGAPGAYLAFLVREKGYHAHVLDYSAVGCAATRRNFELLSLPVTVTQGDLFDDALRIGPFDVVYSLGFIEHFSDLSSVMARHVRLTKPGGLVVVGCPNFTGVNGWFLERLAPDLLGKHNTAMMDPDTWAAFERSLGLEVLWKGHVGGFEPSVFNRWERRSARKAPLRAAAWALTRACRFKPFKLINAPQFSHYVLAAYRTPRS
jgi:SAM-dependent methyltransferase